MTCPLCDEHQETNMHALWLCDQAKAVWKSELSFAVLYKTQFWTFRDLFEAVWAEDQSSMWHGSLQLLGAYGKDAIGLEKSNLLGPS